MSSRTIRMNYERCLELLRPGGLVLVDNVLWSGKVADDDDRSEDTVALRAFNARLGADSRIELCMLPVGDGLTIARKLVGQIPSSARNAGAGTPRCSTFRGRTS